MDDAVQVRRLALVLVVVTLGVATLSLIHI